ncbi:MAG TPA: hypothetical protein VJ689_05735 [Gaiellaceae bacterium]|nr:hypothetical protein [Gaiellaceae bacterium]
MSVSARTPEQVLATIEAADRLLVQQVFKPIANEYRISVPAPGATQEGETLLVVRQKRLSVREDIRFRLDPERDEHLFMIKSKTMFEFRGRHEVLDEHGGLIGQLEKSFGASLLRSSWVVRDRAGQVLMTAQEASLLIALVRRFGELVPLMGTELLSYLPFNFRLQSPNGGEVGHYQRVLGTFRDRYVLELGPEAAGIDRRLLLAFAVALDALQDR